MVRRYAAVPRARTRLTGLLTPAGTDVLTDPLVASRFGLAVIDGDTRLEGYFAGDRGALQRRLRLTSAPEGDVTIRYVTDDLSVEHLYGTDALTALDLMDSDDIRERAAGRDVLERLLGRV